MAAPNGSSIIWIGSGSAAGDQEKVTSYFSPTSIVSSPAFTLAAPPRPDDSSEFPVGRLFTRQAYKRLVNRLPVPTLLKCESVVLLDFGSK